MNRQWIYNEKENPIIIDVADFESYEMKGWKDSPAYFIKLPDVGIDPDDAMKVQDFGDAVEGVVNSLNGALNIGEMDKNELEDYAREHFGCELDKRQKLKTLRKQVQKLIDGPTEH